MRKKGDLSNFEILKPNHLAPTAIQKLIIYRDFPKESSIGFIQRMFQQREQAAILQVKMPCPCQSTTARLL